MPCPLWVIRRHGSLSIADVRFTPESGHHQTIADVRFVPLATIRIAASTPSFEYFVGGDQQKVATLPVCRLRTVVTFDNRQIH